MADPRTGKAGQSATEQATGSNPGGGDSRPLAVDPSLVPLLDAHAAKLATVLGEVIAEKLAALKGQSVEGVHPEQALGRHEEAWLAKYSASDREHLRCRDQEFRCLAETLKGPPELPEDGDSRPPV